VAAGPVRRRGVVLLVAVVCIAVASVIFVSLLQLSAAERRRVEAEAWQVQAAWLAESAVERAVARLAADPNYQGETWSLSPGELGTPHNAVVIVQVETIPEQKQRRLIRVQADYPDHPQHRARHSKQITVEVRPR
jgi:Tfp pilus assembly protein PilV